MSSSRHHTVIHNDNSGDNDISGAENGFASAYTGVYGGGVYGK